MSARYILVVGDGIHEDADFLAALAGASGLTLSYHHGRIAALVDTGCQCIQVGEAGCIVGTLFPRDGRHGPAGNVTAGEVDAIASSRGNVLLASFWGGYVAAIGSPRDVRIIRDPSGILPCYFARCGSLLMFASDAELLVRAGVVTNVDLEEIGRQLYRALVPFASTALTGISELLAGFALHFESRGFAVESFWSPWDHVTDRGISSAELSLELSHTVRHCVHTWLSNRSRVLLSVSGGLDSSVLAACAAQSASDVFCLTMYTDDPTGDERLFARALCTSLGLPLIERPFRLEDVDIGKALAPHLPRPRDRTQALAYEHVHLEIAAEIGADAFMTGNGGDAVFGYSQSAAPVADLCLARGIGRRALVCLLDVCRQTGCNVTDALRQAWRFAHRPPTFEIEAKPLLLHPDFIRSLGRAPLSHSWLNAPAGALPGKAAHIASILRVQSHLEVGRNYHLPVLSPLMSQPIVEACLAIPSWEWRVDGRDRAVARRAFARDLPAIIRERRLKGSPSGFGAKLLDHFRASIRERLLDGRLAARAIVDPAAIERVLASERPIPHAERVRLLEMVNAEAWIDHWSGARSSLAR